MAANYLILINKNLSTRTAKFWNKNKERILSEFADADLYFLDSDQPQEPIDIERHDTVILIGDNSFFNRIINCFFNELSDKTIAFIPDRDNSALTSGLQLPTKINETIELIQCRQTIPLDIIRCHYIDMRGLPANCLVLNDVVMGVSPKRFPLLLRTFVQWCKFSPLIPFTKKQNTITLLQNQNTIYRGKYIISLILLGNAITHGPKVIQKNRINLSKFDYLQLNAQSALEITSPLASVFSRFTPSDNRNSLHKQFSEIEINGLGKENNLIADGIHIGRLPASFTLLPKALRVVSPLNVVTSKRPWTQTIAVAHKVPTPIGSRQVL